MSLEGQSPDHVGHEAQFAFSFREERKVFRGFKWDIGIACILKKNFLVFSGDWIKRESRSESREISFQVILIGHSPGKRGW